MSAKLKSCQICDSTELWRDAAIRDGGKNSAFAAYAFREEDPDAILFNGEEQSRIYAVVCKSCGYVHLFVKDPSELELERDGQAGDSADAC